VLGACRNNPFGEGTKSLGGTAGLARETPPDGTFVMLSAGAGQFALDRLGPADPEPTSVFTRMLIPLMTRPGPSLLDMADQVSADVEDLARSVGHPQRPAFYTNVRLARTVCLAGCAVTPVAAGRPPPQPPSKPPADIALPAAATGDTCTVLAPGFTTIEVAPGDTLCDPSRTYRARVEQIAPRVIRFLQDTGAFSCPADADCQFSWPGAPPFRISAEADPARGLSPRGVLRPR
jgi:hypothetical protein